MLPGVVLAAGGLLTTPSQQRKRDDRQHGPDLRGPARFLPHRNRDGGTAVTDVGRPTLPDGDQEPGGNGWKPVVKHGITAVAVTVTVVLTHSLELATLVGAILHGR